MTVVGLLALLVVGLLVLTRSADQFVLGAARLAAILDVPPVVIGAVVVGFGTSAPEIVASGLAAAQGDTDIALGNIAGSNVANLTLVLGAAALIRPVASHSATLGREAPIAFFAVVAFAVLARDGLSTGEGILLGLALIAVLTYLLVDSRSGSEAELVGEVREYIDADWGSSTWVESTRTGLGLVGTVLGAQALVWSATGIADELDLAQGFVGLTLVAVGTSLPELVTAVAASRRGEEELLVGNLLGSNIFNSLGVSAVVGLVGDGTVDDAGLIRLAMAVMVVVAAVAWVFMATARAVVRWEAVVLLVGYVLVIPLLAG